MLEFTTPDVDLEFYDFDEVDRENISNVSLKWSCDFEVRNWGIKDTYVTVPDQEISFTYEVWTDNDYEVKEETIQIKDVQVDLSHSEYSNHLFPKSLNFYKGKWVVEF